MANRGVFGIRAYESGGQLWWAFGRQGQGPGEFQSINAVYLMTGDSLLVYDAVLRRITILSPLGKLARLLSGTRGFPLGLLTDSTLLVVLGTGAIPQGRPGDVVVTTRRLGILSLRDGQLISSLGEFPYGESVIGPGGQWTSPVFGRSGKATTGPGVFAYGYDDQPEVSAYDALGRPILKIRWVQKPALVTNEDMEAEISAQRELAGRRRVGIGERSPSGTPTAFPPQVAVDTFPFFRKLRMDPRGNLWVEQYAREGERPVWLVFDSTASWRASVLMPISFDLHQVGKNFVAGTVLVEDLRLPAVFRLQRP